MFEEAHSPDTQEHSRMVTFKNQVGGHSCLLKEGLASEYVFKPYNKKEAEFYELITSSSKLRLKEVVPRYYGLESCPQEKLESVTLEDIINVDDYEVPCVLTKKRSLSEQDSPEGLCIRERKEDSWRKIRGKSEWFVQLFKKRFNKDNTKFLKLKDLTTNYKAPSILDLKMGSMAYNAVKKNHQMSKLIHSTSASLGFRICGLSVKTKNKSEHFFDKYWGRNIPPERITNALAIFFHDGEKIRKNLLLKYIKRLKYLHEVISESIGFRFFSTSLLFVYDASLEDEVNDHPSLSDESYETIKLIDFAHCHYDKDSKEGDSNLLAGIENLIDCLTYILENPEIELFSGC